MFLELLNEWLESELGKEINKPEGALIILVLSAFAAWLDSRRPSPRPADRSAIELLRTIRNAGDVEMDDFSDEFWQEVDAVLKTAGGG